MRKIMYKNKEDKEGLDVVGWMAEAMLNSFVVIGFALFVGVPIVLILSVLGIVK